MLRRLRAARVVRQSLPPDGPQAAAAPIDVRSALRWIRRHRAWSPSFVARYARYLRLRVVHPHVVTTGFISLGRGVQIQAEPGLARLVIGRFVHVGSYAALRCHEGTMVIGDKCIVGEYATLNCYLDVRVGAASLIADHVYVSDFDHAFASADVPIKDQGIAKAAVCIGPDVWLGTKVTVRRGVTIGAGTVVGANSVVTRDLPPAVLAAGAPARIIRDRFATVDSSDPGESGNGRSRRAPRGRMRVAGRVAGRG